MTKLSNDVRRKIVHLVLEAAYQQHHFHVTDKSPIAPDDAGSDSVLSRQSDEPWISNIGAEVLGIGKVRPRNQEVVVSKLMKRDEVRAFLLLLESELWQLASKPRPAPRDRARFYQQIAATYEDTLGLVVQKTRDGLHRSNPFAQIITQSMKFVGLRAPKDPMRSVFRAAGSLRTTNDDLRSQLTHPNRHRTSREARMRSNATRLLVKTEIDETEAKAIRETRGTSVTCDSCRNRRDVPVVGKILVSGHLRKAGWTFVRGSEICPACSKRSRRRPLAPP